MMLAVKTKATVSAGPLNPVLMSFTEFGSGDKTLVMLHGLLSRRTQWNRVAGKIAQLIEGRVVAADLRNHGDSPWSSEFSHKAICADVEYLISQLGIKKAHVLGHGLAGRSIVQLALQRSKFIKSVIISESTPFGIPQGFWRLASYMRLLRDTPIKSDVPLAESIEDMNKKLRTTMRNPMIRKLITAQLIEKPGEGIAWHFNLDAILKNMEKSCSIPDLKLDSNVNLPILFISGDASDSLPKSHLKQLVHIFPKATVVYAGGAGYLIFKDRPLFYSEYISGFINKQESIKE